MNSSQIHCKCLHGICTTAPTPRVSRALSARITEPSDSLTFLLQKLSIFPISIELCERCGLCNYRLRRGTKIPVASRKENSRSSIKYRRVSVPENIERTVELWNGGRRSPRDDCLVGEIDLMQRRISRRNEAEAPQGGRDAGNFARKLLSRTEARPQRSVVLPGSSSSPVYGRM